MLDVCTFLLHTKIRVFGAYTFSYFSYPYHIRVFVHIKIFACSIMGISHCCSCVFVHEYDMLECDDGHTTTATRLLSLALNIMIFYISYKQHTNTHMFVDYFPLFFILFVRDLLMLLAVFFSFFFFVLLFISCCAFCIYVYRVFVTVDALHFQSLLYVEPCRIQILRILLLLLFFISSFCLFGACV